jgi:hypothetical protein
MKPQMTEAALEWLSEVALHEVGEKELAEMERIFHALRDTGALSELVSEFDRAAGAYAFRLAEAAFCAGLELAKDPIGYLVHGRSWKSQS